MEVNKVSEFYQKKYALNPKKCKHCEKELSYEKRYNTYCDSSCSATATNLRRGKYSVKCLNCETEINRKDRIYCSHKCRSDYEFKEKLEEFKTGANVDFHIMTIRRIMIEIYGRKCMTCNNAEWMDNPIPLEIHHIDGDADNDTIDNLSQICPNCHALTDNYKAKNKDSSRKYRKNITIKFI